MDRNTKPPTSQSRRAFVTSVAASAAGLTLLSPDSEGQTPTGTTQPVERTIVPPPRKPIIIKGGSCAIELKRGETYDFTYDTSKKRYVLPASSGMSVQNLDVTVIARNEESQDLKERHSAATKVTLVLEGPSGTADTLVVEPRGKDGSSVASQKGEWLTRRADDHPKRKCSWNHRGFDNDTLWFSVTQIAIEGPGGPYHYDGADEYRLKIWLNEA